MPRVLFAPETFNLGETTRAVEIARAMRADGHDVLFMGYSRRFSDYVTKAGFGLELLDPELSETDADRLIAVDQGRGIRHPFTVEMLSTRVSSELDLIQRWVPAVVVIGSTMSMFISARAARVPLVYVKPYAMSRGQLSTMNEFPLLPGDGRAATTLNGLAGRTVRRVVTSVTYKPKAFRVVADEHGVRLPSRTVEMLDGDLNLIASLPPSSDARALADNEQAIGPVYARPDGDLPDVVTSLADGERPVVYVGMGSSANRDLVLRVLDQAARLDVEVISAVGRYLPAGDRARLPANVHVVDFLPAHRLAGLIDASVIHGGEGTVQTACASGAPFAGIGLQAEQRWNVRECELFGNALGFTARHLRRGELHGIVTRLLEEPRLAEAAREMRRRMQALDGPGAASRIIGQLAR